MSFSSAEFYHGLLLADNSVKCRLLTDLPNTLVDGNYNHCCIIVDNTESSIVFIDTSHSGFRERYGDSEEGSKFNDGESLLVLEHVRQLLSASVLESDIAVISPYNAQVSLLKSILLPLYPLIEIGSIDGFQGIITPVSLLWKAERKRLSSYHS